MLTFLTPWWGAAMLAAIGAPLLAHLLSRMGGRVAVFPTVRFVQQASADVARLLRPRHWLLMALRMTLLSLIVLAFMQPVWHRAAAAGTGEGLLVAVVVDRSASMNRTRRGVSLFDEAKRQAMKLLNSLDPARDRASVILVDARPVTLLPEPSANFSELMRRLSHVEPTFERGRLDQALRLAATLTDPGDEDAGPRRSLRIELFTDAQATSWPGRITRDLASSLRIHSIGEPIANVAVSRPVLTPTRPIVGQPATLTVDVANHTAHREPIAIELRVGGAVQRQTITVDPFTVSAATFSVVFDDAGPAVIEVAIVDQSDDALAVDDRVGLVADVAPARPVTLVTRASISDPQAAAYFVARAVAPDEDGRAAGVDLSVMVPTELAAAPSTAGSFNVFILIEAGAVDDADLAALRQRLEAGDGVIWIVDSSAAAQSLRRFTASPIAPAASNPWLTQQPRSLAAGRFDDPILAVFEGPARSALLRQAFHNSLRGSLAPEAVALLTFDDAAPAIAARWIGAGRLTVIAADLSPDSTDLIKGPLLVPLLHQLIRYAAPGIPQPPNPHPGQPLDLPIEPGQVLRRPGNAAPGLHAVVNQATDDLVTGVWVEVDPAESDLRAAPWQAGKTLAAETSGEPRDHASVTTAGREVGVELWPYAVLAALLLAGLETLVLWRLNPRPTGEALRA